MYMRLLRIAVQDDRFGGVREFYLERVLPSLSSTRGCVYASLLEPSLPGGHCLSLTLWHSQEAADDYEHSGLFAALLDEVGPVLGERAEASTSHGTDLPLAAELEEYQLITGTRHLTPEDAQAAPHLRLVSMLVRRGSLDELAALYRTDIVPALERTQGCRGAFFLQGIDNPERTLAISLWQRDEDAVRYELSGACDEIVVRLRGLLSGLYQWRVSQASPGGPPTEVGADQLDVHRYRVVTGRSLDPAEEDEDDTTG